MEVTGPGERHGASPEEVFPAVPPRRVHRAGGASRASLVLFAAGISLAGSAAARNFGDYLSYNAGLFAFQPQLDVGAYFTDNLFYSTGAQRESDLAGVFSPGLRLQYGRDGENQASLDYTHDEFVYLNNPVADTRQDRLAFRLTYEKSRLRLDGRSNLDFLSSFLGGSVNQQGRLIYRRIWHNDYKLTWDITEKTDLYFDAQYNDTDYQQGIGLLDMINLRGSLGASYQITSRFRLFGEGFLGHSTVSPNLPQPQPPDSIVYGGFFGVRGQFTPKISGSVKAGYELRQFSGGGSQSASTPAVGADVTWAAGPLTSLQLRYDRRTSPAPQFGAQNVITDDARLILNQLIGVTGRWAVQAQVGYRQWEFQEQFRNFAVPGGVVAVDVGRTDSTYLAGLALVYQPQPWLRGSLSYDFEKFNTSFNDPLAAGIFRLAEYVANRVMLTVSFGY